MKCCCTYFHIFVYMEYTEIFSTYFLCSTRNWKNRKNILRRYYSVEVASSSQTLATNHCNSFCPLGSEMCDSYLQLLRVLTVCHSYIENLTQVTHILRKSFHVNERNKTEIIFPNYPNVASGGYSVAINIKICRVNSLRTNCWRWNS